MITLKKRAQKEFGLTLLEISAVLGILGITSAIAVPSFANFRQHNLETEVTRQISAVADQVNLNKGRGSHSVNYGLKDISNSIQKSSSMGDIKTPTTFKLTKTVTGEFCLTATNGDYRVLYDSTLNLRGGLSEESTENCSMQLNTEAYELGRDKIMRPKVEQESRPVHCPVQTGSITSDSFWAQVGINGGVVQNQVRMAGSFTLNEDCQTIDYRLRVVNADPTATYIFPLYAQDRAHEMVTIRGTETIESTIRLNTPPTDTVFVAGTIRSDQFERLVSWDSKGTLVDGGAR